MLLNAYVVLGIVAHFINKDGRCCYTVLGLCEVHSEYTGENMAAVLIALFKDYRIAGNLGYFMADNADINNICINAIL